MAINPGASEKWVLFILLSGLLGPLAIGTGSAQTPEEGYRLVPLNRPGEVSACGDIIYWVHNSLQLLDASDPTDIKAIPGAPRLTINEFRPFVQRRNDRLFIITNEFLICLDLSDPRKPQLTGSYEFSDLGIRSGWKRYIDIMDNFLVVGIGDDRETGSGRFYILHQDETGTISQLSSVNTGALFGLVTCYPFIYAANSNGIQVFDAHDPNRPRRLGAMNFDGKDSAGCLGLVRAGSHLAVVESNRIQLVACNDIEPTNGLLVSQLDLQETYTPFEWVYSSDIKSHDDFILVKSAGEQKNSLSVVEVDPAGDLNLLDTLEFGPLASRHTAVVNAGLFVWLSSQNQMEAECRLYSTENW